MSEVKSFEKIAFDPLSLLGMAAASGATHYAPKAWGWGKEQIKSRGRKLLKNEILAGKEAAAKAASESMRNKAITYGALAALPAAAVVHQVGKNAGAKKMEKRAGVLDKLKNLGKSEMTRDVRDIFVSKRESQVRAFRRAMEALPGDAKSKLADAMKSKALKHGAIGVGLGLGVGAGAGYATGRNR